jgi:putative ABC transport system permease protein
LQNIVIIGCIGFAILLIACFNFINLSIALNIRRYREAGIKKVVGAQRINIIAQHFGETIILTLLSLVTAIDLAGLVVRALNRTYNSDIRFNFSDIGIILIFVGITLFTAILSGLLPALYLSSSKPVNILKGKILTNHSFSFFRQGLIVFQFTIPVILIICMMIIRAQDKFIRYYDLGFDKNRLMVISGSKQTLSHAESIRNELLSVPGIESVSFSSCIPARGTRVSNEVSWEGRNPSEKLHFWCIAADHDYAGTVNIRMTDGRYFDKSFTSDSTCYVINDVAAKVMDYKNPVGKSIILDGKKGTIIGVFSGFHAIDLAGPFTPTIISLSGEGRNNILIELGEVSFPEINGRIKEIFGKYDPEMVFNGSLYSDLIKRTELTTVSYLVGLAFVISILLACLGLSGLASFTAASRTKEIGIRKINGATVVSILRLLGLNYSRWLIIASVLAVPIAFLLGNFFLGRFNFRTPVPYWAFFAGPVIAYVISLSTVLLQSLRAATRNPVEALRYE